MTLSTVLIFTCSEYGQANVHIAASYELALAGVNVCIGSFAPLAARVSRLQELVSRDASRSGVKPGSIVFHEIKGPSYWDGLEKNGINDANLPHPHGVSGTLQCYSRILDHVGFPWSLEEHRAIIDCVKEITKTVNPSLLVVDPLFLPAVDACCLMGQKFVGLLPNTIREVAGSLQPNLASFWKYPVGGFPFPLMWWQIPLNIYLNIRLIIHALTSEKITSICAMRKSLGISPQGGYQMRPGVTYVCPSLPEIDLPFSVIPEQLVLCGPIVMPFDPLEEKDPELMKWLDNGPTVMINLGSHAVADERLAKEMTGAFRLLLDHHDRKGTSKIQVLWKVRKNGDIQKVIDEVVGKEIKEGMVKVVAWLDAEPVSILQHPNVVCTVHHGGANSYFEGVWSGVPHIVLPVWLDTYDFATRAEFLNIGIFGNKTCAPGVRAEEFGKALIRVTGDGEEASKFRSTAKRLNEVCRAKGEGRKLAAMAILKEMDVKV